jgi:hypothetical protein
MGGECDTHGRIRNVQSYPKGNLRSGDLDVDD